MLGLRGFKPQVRPACGLQLAECDRVALALTLASGVRARRRTEPGTLEAATLWWRLQLCGGGCNPLWWRLQPSVVEAAALCGGGCNTLRRRTEPGILEAAQKLKMPSTAQHRGRRSREASELGLRWGGGVGVVGSGGELEAQGSGRRGGVRETWSLEA